MAVRIVGGAPSGSWRLVEPAGDPVTVEESSFGTLYAVHGGSSEPVLQF